MCVMCHLADTPIAREYKESWLLYYNTYPMGMAAGVILPYNYHMESAKYSFQRDADGVIDAQYYGLPGDAFDYSWTF